MGVMLDTSALIGLYEADESVRQQLRVALEENDDGSEPKTHAVVIGELRTGVLTIDSLENEPYPRLPVLETALTLDIETIEAGDPSAFAALTLSTKRALGQNDRWICAAAIRTRTTLITQDNTMAEQLVRYFDSLDLLDALQTYVGICCVPRDPREHATQRAHSFNVARRAEAIEAMLANLAPADADLLRSRFGIDQKGPRTLQQVARMLGATPAQVAKAERQAIDQLRSLGY